MKVEVIEKSKLGRELVFEVEKQKVDSEKSRIIQEIKKNAVVGGFRKGKVPEEIIETRFADTIKENLLQKIIPESYVEAIKKHNIDTVIEPSVYDVQLNDTGLKFKVYTEIKPDVVIKKYKNIPVKRQKPQDVTEQEVETMLQRWEKKPEFSASIIDPAKRRAWKDKIRSQMEEYNKMKASMQEERDLWEAIFKDTDFEVPEKLIEKRAAQYTENHYRTLDLKDKTKEEKEKIVQEIFEKAKSVANTDLKKYFILDKIAEIEKITVSQQEINSRIESISRSVGEPCEKIEEKLNKSGKIFDLEDEIRIDKAFALLKENSQWIERIILPDEEKRIQTK